MERNQNMNQGQERFYAFFMERTADEHKAAAEAILQENFRRQDEGTFDREYMASVMPKLFAMVKPEAMEELKQAMAHFSSGL